MAVRDLPPLPGVDPETAPLPDDPEYGEWIDRVAFSPEGVDRTLIWDMLHRTPTERLEVLETLSREMAFLIDARAAARRK